MDLALLVCMGAWLPGSFICGVCGLGAAIVAMPFMLAVLPVQQVALISCLIALGLTCHGLLVPALLPVENGAVDDAGRRARQLCRRASFAVAACLAA